LEKASFHDNLAKSGGFAIQPKKLNKDENEVVVAFTRDLFLTYAFNLETYHPIGLKESEIEAIDTTAKQYIQEPDLTILPESRRTVIRRIEISIRDARFRNRILKIYQQRCAICGIQLNLVAAHIVPVKDGGTDEITNGIALCPNHHSAFDQGLILLTSDRQVVLNMKKAIDIIGQDLDDGMDSFQASLNIGKTIYLPQDPKYWPSKENIEKRHSLENFRSGLQD
jgi:putative restriction endonuclease